MTTATFYVLPPERGLAAFVAELTAKLWRQGHTVWLCCQDDMTDGDNPWLTRLDDTLWQHPNDGFLPHGVVADDGSDSAAKRLPIQLGSAYPERTAHFDVIFNLATSAMPEDVACKHVIECISEERAALRAAQRAHYQQYRARGYTMRHYALD